MAEQHTATSSKSSPLNFVFGLIFIAAGAATNLQVPVPGLELNLSHTMAMVGMMLILFPVIKTFYVQPLSDAIHERTTNLERTFTEAEQLRSEMTKMKSDYEARLVATEAQAREQIQSQIKEAQQLRSDLMAEAASKADELLRKAQEEIIAERSRVITGLRVHVVDLALGATEKILGENVGDARNRKLIEEFVEKIEVPG